MNYVTALKEVIDLLDALKILEKVKAKLLNNPDAAAGKLSGVLNELAKSYQTLDDAMVSMAMLSFRSEEEFKDALRDLLKLGGGRVRAEIAEARGHCAKIWNIYERDLHGWFSRVLNREETSKLEELFERLHGFDTEFIWAIEQISDDLERIANELLQLVYQNKHAEAQEKVKTLAAELSEPRKALSEGMVRLWNLQAFFIEVGRVASS